MEEKFTFKVNVGDWSNDGHGKCDTILVLSNISANDAQKAYMESVKEIMEQFPNQNIFSSNGELVILSEYNENWILIDEFTELNVMGICPDEEYTYNEIDDEDGDFLMYVSSENLARILMNTIKRHNRDFKYKIIEDEIPNFNGFWGDLNVHFGYGLFD